jgi:hypothetical protein
MIRYPCHFSCQLRQGYPLYLGRSKQPIFSSGPSTSDIFEIFENNSIVIM